MKVKSALILCAGYGRRLAPITYDVPKPLLKVKNVNFKDLKIFIDKNFPKKIRNYEN